MTRGYNYFYDFLVALQDFWINFWGHICTWRFYHYCGWMRNPENHQKGGWIRRNNGIQDLSIGKGFGTNQQFLGFDQHKFVDVTGCVFFENGGTDPQEIVAFTDDGPVNISDKIVKR